MSSTVKVGNEGAMYSPAFGRWGMKTEEGIVPLMFCEGYDTENIVNLNTF